MKSANTLKAAKQLEIPEAELEVIEEFEPDDLDLKAYQEAEGLAEPPGKDDVTLYMVRVSMPHYIRRAGEFTQGLIER